MVDTQKNNCVAILFWMCGPDWVIQELCDRRFCIPKRLTITGYENRLAFAGAKHERVTLFMPL